jgi:hypothetical protein
VSEVYRDDQGRRRVGWVLRKELIEAFLPVSTVEQEDAG